MKNEIEAKIEYQEVIGEAKPGDYQPVRFTRIKYKASPTAHIDIRQFQRGYNDESEEAFFPTKKGFRFGIVTWFLRDITGSLLTFVFMPVSLTIVLIWILSGFIESIINGLVIARIYK